jgi:serine/threonine protein kinase
METDLHRIIYSKQPLTIDHIQYFLYQIIRGLKYIHSAGVIHRALKPSNLLVKSNCALKICDFGLSRGVEDEQSGDLTEYVVTRWYRAPEIMLACQDYTKAIDVWSVGCVFAELLARAPLFPGSDYIAQLRLICEKMGRPAEKDLDFVASDRARKFMQSLATNPPAPLAELFPNHTDEPEAMDLLLKALCFNPSKRITIDEMLIHPFMEPLHNAADEPRCESMFFFEHDSVELGGEQVKELSN